MNYLKNNVKSILTIYKRIVFMLRNVTRYLSKPHKIGL